MTRKYRVIQDSEGFFIPQVKYKFCPFWITIYYYRDMESAVNAAREHKETPPYTAAVVWRDSDDV